MPFATKSLGKEWALVAAATISGAALFASRGHDPRAGDVVTAAISLVLEDRYGLACAYPEAVSRYRCEFQDRETASSPPPPSKERLAPVVTDEHAVFLVPGLFDEPTVGKYAARHYGDKRFTARCKLRLVARLVGYELRFRQVDPWGAGRPAWVAEPVSCSVE